MPKSRATEKPLTECATFLQEASVDRQTIPRRDTASSPDSSTQSTRITRLELRTAIKGCILGLGAESTAVACLRAGRVAYLTQPIGSLTEPACYRRYVRANEALRAATGLKPDVVAHDLHPLYMSSRYAVNSGLPRESIQHHHAHVAAVMADNGEARPVVGICCDGVGFGTDGAAWGGEVLSCSVRDFTRVGHLAYFPLVGGDLAAIENWRPAAALLAEAFGADWLSYAPQLFHRLPEAALHTFHRAMEHRINVTMTSSLGRLFDGVAFLLGVSERNDEAAQAARILERIASNECVEPFPYETTIDGDGVRMSMGPVIRAIVRDLERGTCVEIISARFHETMVRMLCTAAILACDLTGLSTVALSGGCFANRRLMAGTVSRLERNHVRVLIPRRISFGDEGLALGQAAVASARIEGAETCASHCPQK